MKKYEDNRELINTGDLILFRNNKEMKPLSKAIQKFDRAYYNHIGLVFSFGEGPEKRNFILDSNAPGVKPEMLSARMDNYEDFCVLKPRKKWRDQATINSAVSKVLQRAEDKIKYDFTLLLEIAVERSLQKNVLNFDKKNRDICSEFTYRYAKALLSIAYDLTKKQWGWISPQDFLRFRDKREFDLLLDEASSNIDYDQTNLK